MHHQPRLTCIRGQALYHAFRRGDIFVAKNDNQVRTNKLEAAARKKEHEACQEPKQLQPADSKQQQIMVVPITDGHGTRYTVLESVQTEQQLSG